jgi:hypothetical protein
MQTFALYVLATVGLLELGLFFWMVRSLRNQQQLEGRLGHLTEALSLLTETTEAGFRANAVEIARIAERPAPGRAPSRRTPSSRVAGPLGRGRTTAQAAPDERMSEGEAHLRLRLAEEAGDRAAAMRLGRRKETRRRAASQAVPA